MSPARVTRLRRTRDVVALILCMVGISYGFAALNAQPAPAPSFTPMQLPTLDVE